MVNNIVRWPFSIFCPQHIADWWNGISVCCLKWVQLITNFERVLWRWLKAECVVCVCRGVNKISRNFSNVWRTWQRSIPNFHRNEKSWEILSPQKRKGQLSGSGPSLNVVMSIEISLTPQLRDWQARWAVPPRKQDKEKEGETRLNSDPGLHCHCCCCGSGVGDWIHGTQCYWTFQTKLQSKYAQLFSEVFTE